MKSWCLRVEEVQQAFHDYTSQKSSLCSTLSHLASSSWNVQKPDPCKICPEGILREQMTSKRKEGCFMASALFLPVDFGRSDWTFCSRSPRQKGCRTEWSCFDLQCSIWWWSFIDALPLLILFWYKVHSHLNAIFLTGMFCHVWCFWPELLDPRVKSLLFFSLPLSLLVEKRVLLHLSG